MVRLLSSHISKLGGSRIPSFNLPSKRTCPGKTEQCVKYCYATKGHFLYEGTKNKYERNLIASKQDDFVEKFINELYLTNTFIRIHTSGDFYNQEYFDKICQIARKRPDTKFLAYTRNYRINIKNAPRNLIIFYTVDNSTKILNPDAKHYAFVDHFDVIPEHGSNYKNGIICTGKDCSSCLKCWNKPANVYFPQKYKKYSERLLDLYVNS